MWQQFASSNLPFAAHWAGDAPLQTLEVAVHAVYERPDQHHELVHAQLVDAEPLPPTSAHESNNAVGVDHES